MRDIAASSPCFLPTRLQLLSCANRASLSACLCVSGRGPSVQICLVAEKFAPSKRWQIDTVVSVLAIVSRDRSLPCLAAVSPALRSILPCLRAEALPDHSDPITFDLIIMLIHRCLSGWQLHARERADGSHHPHCAVKGAAPLFVLCSPRL